ncbi:hypothetical protein BD310DRAFT_920310 [Dichomitus squalens]|uniref:Uncharacterized protein n=1 Tax=Dichomitus squalens TaxID=114155 RepID=A0A4Q9Q4Q2_9APHY|nr:hypothetical protein BD310DRAFT_920310 [Dichomitus squalens]
MEQAGLSSRDTQPGDLTYMSLRCSFLAQSFFTPSVRFLLSFVVVVLSECPPRYTTVYLTLNPDSLA